MTVLPAIAAEAMPVRGPVCAAMACAQAVRLTLHVQVIVQKHALLAMSQNQHLKTIVVTALVTAMRPVQHALRIVASAITAETESATARAKTNRIVPQIADRQ